MYTLHIKYNDAGLNTEMNVSLIIRKLTLLRNINFWKDDFLIN